MSEEQSKAREYLHLILNIAISSLLAAIEQLLCKIQATLIWDFVFIPCGILFSIIYITRYFHWNKGDLSSFFFWALIIKRIFLLGINEGEFIFFLFGLLNGIYTNKLNIIDQKKYYWKSKTILQVIIISVLIIINLMNEARDYNSALITLLILVSIMLGINDNIDLQKQPIMQDEYKTDLKHNQFELKKCQTQIGQFSSQQQQQSQQQRSNWEQYQQLTDEWICKIEINKYSLIESLNTSEQNYAMRKSLGDYKISILELFQHLMITSQSTNLQQSINLCPEIVETNSLINWLEKNFFQESSGAKLEIGRSKQQKYGIEEIQVRQEDEISIISPQYEGKATYNKDQIYEQQALSAFQQNGELQGSVSAFSNKTTLGCYFITNQVKIEKSVSIFMMGDEYDVKKNILMFVIRNIDVEIRKFKTNLEKTEQHRNVFYKYIKRIADDACQILQQVVQIKRGLDLRQKDFDKIKQGNFIALSFCDGDAFIKSEKVIGETKISQHLNIPYQQVVQNTTQRVTSSITQNADSQEEQFQKLYTISQTSDFIKQIEKWQYNLMLIEHNNFNFFEVFSSIEYEAHQFNFIKTLSIVKDIFKADSCIVKHNIMICQELHNENQMELISDKRRVKQVLINIIKNSIQCFDYNLSKKQSQNLTSLSTEQKQGMKQQEQKAQNIIVIKTWAHEDKINVEITDNGGGIKQEMLKNRPQDCKLGLKACEKILKSLSTDQNKPLEIVNYVKSKDGQSGTSVLFNLTKLFMSTVTTDENVFSDSLTIINKVLN